jgi:hypothetical protein
VLLLCSTRRQIGLNGMEGININSESVVEETIDDKMIMKSIK